MDPSQGRPALPSTAAVFRAWLAAGVFSLNLFALSMAAFSLWQSWRNHQERALSAAQNLALVLDRYVADTLGKADLALWALKDESERVLASRGAASQDPEALIHRQLERTPGLAALGTTDARGVVDREGGDGAGAAADVGDRGYFLRLQEAPGSGLVISEPLPGRFSGDWEIVLARRLEAPGRRFAGVAYAVVKLDQFDRAFSALDVGPHGSVALRDLDLRLVVRSPGGSSPLAAVGQSIVSDGLQAFARSGRTAGSYRAVTPIDGVKRTFFVRRVSEQPFYLLVGLAERDYLAEWRREVIRGFGVMALFLGATLLAAWWIHRAWTRQQSAHDRLHQLLAEVKSLSGMMPICSHCKKVRDDKGYWNQIEAYLNEHTDAEFTHGICPDCAKEVFPKASGRHRTL